jgi:basic membrane protein A
VVPLKISHALVLPALLAAAIASPGTPAADALVTSPRIGMVADTHGLFDRSFNQLTAAAVQSASYRLGARIDVRASAATGSYVVALQNMAAQGYDLVIAIGPSEERAVGIVARQFPSVNFAIVDDSYASPGIGGLPNVQGLLFKEQESGYLVGYLAGLIELSKGPRLHAGNIVSSVGGTQGPSVDRYLAGFQAGVLKADPGVKLLNSYTGPADSVTRCHSLAAAQIAAGSDIVFQAAGACGAGVLQAANERAVWSIGSDFDESTLSPSVLASAVDRADQAVFLTIAAVRDGTFAGGRDVVFGAAQSSTGIAGISAAVPASIRAKLDYVVARMRGGKITVPTALLAATRR